MSRPYQQRGGSNYSKGGYNNRDRNDTPGELIEIGKVLHPCEGSIVVALTLKDKLPYPSAHLFLKNQSKIGRLDEVLGPLDDVYFNVKLERGLAPASFDKDQPIYASSDKIMPASRVTNPRKAGAAPRGPKRGPGGPGGRPGGRPGGFNNTSGGNGGRPPFNRDNKGGRPPFNRDNKGGRPSYGGNGGGKKY